MIYQRYEPLATFGIISSNLGNSIHLADNLFIAPALETCHIWDSKKGLNQASWTDKSCKAEVSAILKLSPSTVAVGFFFKLSNPLSYADGSIRIWDVKTNSTTTTFNGHKTQISALAFHPSTNRLASGSKDTDLVVWDLTLEAGLYRLRGHKDQITGIKFLSIDEKLFLSSVSKDSLLKIWDLDTQHCQETIIAHKSEICALESSLDGKLLFTSAQDQELKVWDVDLELLTRKLSLHSESNNQTDEVLTSAISLKTTLTRQSKERCSTLLLHPTGRFLACQGRDRFVEVFKFRNEAEMKKREVRLKKRNREKKKENEIVVVDEIVPYKVLNATSNIRSFDFVYSDKQTLVPKKKVSQTTTNSIQIICALTNNSVEVYALDGTKDEDDDTDDGFQLISNLELQGHRSDVRAVALSNDDELIASGSNDSLKIWNVVTRQCIKSMECGYVLCCAFIPGNKHVIVGTKTGELQIFDLSSASLLESIKCHDGPIWSLEVRPDRGGLTTGSADKEVKFFDFQLVQETPTSKKQLSLLHTRTLKMSDDILSVRHSPDGKLIACSLLDSTIKVFFMDTLKFSLSLYGHKLPVLSMDISSDSTLIATGSADKTIKLWGLDFGDCHRSIYAHLDSVMQVKFVWGTHYLFSVGKDKVVKYWDGDRFEQIMKLEGHHGEVWALAVAKFGNFVVTGSHDRSIRVWEKTEEQLFLAEERERELEEMYEQKDLHDHDGTEGHQIGSMADEGMGDLVLDENGNAAALGIGAADAVGIAGKKTTDTLKAGEKLIEALDVWKTETESWKEYRQALANGVKNVSIPQKSPYIFALNIPDMDAEGYVMHVIEKIRPSDLEQALLTLPFIKVEELLQCIKVWSERGANIQLTTRILTFIIKLHFNQLSSSMSGETLTPLLESIQVNTTHQLRLWKDQCGFNFAGLKLLMRGYEGKHNMQFFDDKTMEEAGVGGGVVVDGGNKKKKKGQKRRMEIVSQQ